MHGNTLTNIYFVYLCLALCIFISLNPYDRDTIIISFKRRGN